MTWQPIETAPKDGTAVLLFCPNAAGGFIMVGYRIGYGDFTDNLEQYDSYAPSHWMPLPEPPDET